MKMTARIQAIAADGFRLAEIRTAATSTSRVWAATSNKLSAIGRLHFAALVPHAYASGRLRRRPRQRRGGPTTADARKVGRVFPLAAPQGYRHPRRCPVRRLSPSGGEPSTIGRPGPASWSREA